MKGTEGKQMRKLLFIGNKPLRCKGSFEIMDLMRFKILLLSVSVLSGTALAARVGTGVEAPLPAVFGDGVASQEEGMPDRGVLLPKAGIMRLTFSVANAAATNSAAAAFGGAGLGGGQMNPASTRFALAYDGARAEWHLRHDSFRLRHAAPASGTSLTATLRLDPSSGGPKSVAFSENGSPVSFGGMDATSAVLRSLFTFAGPGLVRVTSKNGAEAALSIEYAQEGTLLFIR